MITYFTRQKFSAWLILILIVLNVATLAVLLVVSGAGEGHGFGKHGSSKGLKHFRKEINFSASQEARFQDMLDAHIERKTDLKKQMQQAKNAYFGRISQMDENDPDLKPLLEKIGTQQMAMDQELYRHFREVWNLCDGEQRQVFDQLFDEVFGVIAGQRPKHRMGPPPRLRI